jgi:DNA topoisomerase-1
MPPAEIENIKVRVLAGDYQFKADGSRITFDGFTKVYYIRFSENILPKFKKGDKVYPFMILGEQNFTKPPARYSEATLIKELEQHGIGRPSTYASIVSTILSRKYVEKIGKYFKPTPTGKVVNKLLVKYFNDIVDLGFTAEMESKLDKIAEGEEEWTEVIEEFYKPFEKELEKGEKNISKEEFTVLGKAPDNIKCPECGSPMVIKLSRYGTFYSCKKFPDCKGMRDMEGKTDEEKQNELQKKAKSKEFKEKYQPAPKTEDGRDYLLKSGKYGEFWAHPDYPKKKDIKSLQLKPDKIREIYGEPPKTEDGRDYLLKNGRYGEFWAHPDYPKKKDIKKIKKSKKSSK